MTLVFFLESMACCIFFMCAEPKLAAAVKMEQENDFIYLSLQRGAGRDESLELNGRAQSFGSVGPYEILPNNSTSSKDVCVYYVRAVVYMRVVPQERSWELIFYTRLRGGAVVWLPR